MDTTADEKEIGNFSAMSAEWWDETGPMAPLHDFTPVRVDYILDSIRRIGTGANTRAGNAPLARLRVLDIGCGAAVSYTHLTLPTILLV